MKKGIKAIIFSLILCIGFAQAGQLRASALWIPPAIPTCNAIYLVNTDTNTVLYEKNQNEKIYPASTTKIMTAILVYEKFKDSLNTTVTVESDDITPLDGQFGSLVPLVPGEQLSVEQLLYCLLVKSGDDSANTLARATAGSTVNFVAMMNAKAKEIGATSTHYVNAHGLHDPQQYTTAYDTYLISKYAMQYQELATIVDTSEYQLAATNKTSAETFINTNFLIDAGHTTFFNQYVKGIKTGTTTPAGACLASYAENGGETYYCIAMGGVKGTNGTNTAFSDTDALYQWAFNNFQIEPIVKTTDLAAQVNVGLASKINSLTLVPQKQINALVPDDFKAADIKVTYHGPTSIDAPITQGQKIGTEDISIIDPTDKSVQKIGTVNLIASQSIQRSQALYVLSLIEKFFNSKWFKIIGVALVFLLVFYIGIGVYLNRRKKKSKRKTGRGKKNNYSYKR